MALSEYEKRVLAEMEQHLRADDPNLAKTMGKIPEEPPTPQARKKSSPRALALAFVGVAVGLVLLLAGVTIGYSILGTVLGVLGVGVMIAAVLVPFGGFGRGGGRRGKKATKDPKPNPPATGKGKRSSFMDRQAEKWDRREDK